MKLKEYRVKSNLTQADVAKIINKTAVAYSYYESGRNEPDLESLRKLATYYHTTIDNLIDFKVPYLIDKSTLTQSQQELFEKIRNLSDTNCKRVNDFINGLLIAEEEKEKIIEKYKKGE